MEIFNQSAPKTSKSRKKAKQPAPEAVECGEPVFWMPAKDQDDMYPLFQKDIDAWAKEFPTLDVMEELRKMLERAENPMETARQGRKVYDPRYLTTYRGVKNGVRNWLKKGVSFQQERAARRQQIPKPAGAPSGGEVPDTRQPWQIARDAEWERNHPDYRPIEGNPFDTILGPAPEEEILPKDEDEQAPPPVSTAEAADGSAWVYGRGEKPDADTLWRRAHPDLAAMLDRNRAEEQEQKQARAEQAAGGQISTRESEQPAAEPETGPDGDDEEIECPF